VSGERPQLDLLPAADIVGLLLDAEARVVPAVRAVAEQIAAGADLIAGRLAAGGRLLFAGAGTSGRIAAAEAAELPGTFGLDRARIGCRVAGGSDSTDSDEDDLAGAERDIAELALTGADVLVAVAAQRRDAVHACPGRCRPPGRGGRGRGRDGGRIAAGGPG